MSATTSKVMIPPTVAPPRGAAWASALFAELLRLGQALWRAMEDAGQARARSELLRLADLYADQPAFARELRAAAQRGAMSRD